MMTKCTHWFGHKFEARYSIGQPATTSLKAPASTDPEYLIMAIEASKPKTYERDICVRCGAVIEKK